MSSICILNVGLYRTGSCTLANAADKVGFKVFRTFPTLSSETLKLMLLDPSVAVQTWWLQEGKDALRDWLTGGYNFICDGWIALLPFLSDHELLALLSFAEEHGVRIVFVATQRDKQALVQSELQHWVVCDLERRVNLSMRERCNLSEALGLRWENHQRAVRRIKYGVGILPLSEVESWASTLEKCSKGMNLSYLKWKDALARAGLRNKNPELPVQGILLTVRLGSNAKHVANDVQRLVRQIERDVLCKYLLVLALDQDEAYCETAKSLQCWIRKNSRATHFEMLTNDPVSVDSSFPICRAWNKMAMVAYGKDADWVVLLGDDIDIRFGEFHYRAFYRAFLDIADRLGCDFGFACPWWDDVSFPGFPTFPAVGKAHFACFGGLIPDHRKNGFINQDLDPYLQRLYLKFGAAPRVEGAILSNQRGGNNTNPARYDRIPASGWRDWVLLDVDPIRQHLDMHLSPTVKRVEYFLVDVIVPSYRIDVPILQGLCDLVVPSRMRSSLIIIVDNPIKLCKMMKTHCPRTAALKLESLLTKQTSHKSDGRLGNNVRVRCHTTNLGASAARNYGIRESAAEFVLFLDDDVRPGPQVLFAYETALVEKSSDCVGLIGLVRFPRRHDLSIIHSAVLMSYLTFMFEIAANPIYTSPQWGVTANILLKRLPGMHFDTNYAKSGGGEDVDFCLRTLAETKGHFLSVKEAFVNHDYWKGGVLSLFRHFFNWAIGDGLLFSRFPQHTYCSYWNVSEILLLVWLPISTAVVINVPSAAPILLCGVFGMVAVDAAVDMTNLCEFNHRRRLLGDFVFSEAHYMTAHILANIYVAVLELGRLCGHIKRGELAKHVGRRFDWHCGRLPNSQGQVVKKERMKFWLFVAVATGTLTMISYGSV